MKKIRKQIRKRRAMILKELKEDISKTPMMRLKKLFGISE